MIAALAALAFLAGVLASSHSEAPGTARGPHTDLTDFYMFMTRRNNVALVMNIAGLSQSQAGPNYTPINNDYVYQIHIDNDGDAYEDITFQFVTGYRYVNNGRGIEVAVPQGVNVPLPLAHVAGGPFGPITYNAATGVTSNLNAEEYYRLRVLNGDDYSTPIEDGPFASSAGVNGESSYEFTKAFDNAGTKSFGEAAGTASYTNYEAYVNGAAVYTNVAIPGCATPASLFVGPRRESFGIALGEVFDAINIDGSPVFQLNNRSTVTMGSPLYDGNSIDKFSVISFVLEISPSCLRNTLPQSGDVLGAWASVRTLEHRRDNERDGDKHYAGAQTTRLGNPLVNELLIGTTYKNEWNSRHPSGDERFNEFLLNPVVPAYISALYGVGAPAFQRVDLIAILHTGIAGFNLPLNQARQVRHYNKKRNVAYRRHGDDDDDDGNLQNLDGTSAAPVYADMLRLNVTMATFSPCLSQNPLGLVGGDVAGYPIGRRLGDDVVDITLRAAMGVLCTSAASSAKFCGGAANIAPAGTFSYTDQAPNRACMFKCGTNDFPFLNPPIPGNVLFNPQSLYSVSQFYAGCGAGAAGVASEAATFPFASLPSLVEPSAAAQALEALFISSK